MKPSLWFMIYFEFRKTCTSEITLWFIFINSKRIFIARGIISFIIPVMRFVNKVNSTGPVKWNFYWKYSCVFISMVTFFHLETIRSVFRWQFLITFIFSVSLQLRVYYIKDQWGEFTVKNATLYSHIPFLAYFLLLFIKKNVLLSFSFLFFDEVSSYRNIILTNQKLE